VRVAILSLPLFLLSAFCTAFAATFPSKVKNECSTSWHESVGNKFLVATVNVLVDLKNSANEVEEKAYIYLDCKGKADKYRRETVPKVIGTTCVGVRMNGLSRSSLSSPWVFPIYPDNIEVISKPGQQPVVLKWQERSTFIIDSGKSFQWKMKSVISERTHSGTTTCQ
jgi:hypothetical protein